jgi:transcriptional regulator GlxA family with amidase domain
MRANTARKSNIVNIPPSELLRMVGELGTALEADPGSARKIALKFLERIASSDARALDSARGGLAPWQKRKLDRFLRGNLGRSIGLSELAGAVRLSVSHFSRAFKRTFGETPHAHLQRLRLELAQKLMLTTDGSLSQIALRCGLADQAHLSKLFRRRLHDTPNAWRRRNLTEAHVEALNGFLDAAA